MPELAKITPIDYLIIGHITQDLTPQGRALGGTASYAALTAKAIGKNVGIVTACRSDLDLGIFDGISITRKNSRSNSLFENIYKPEGRTQYLHEVASEITLEDIPSSWRDAPIVHLGPVDWEIAPDIFKAFPDSLVCLTPQGFLRRRDDENKVSFCNWADAETLLPFVDIAVMSIEDVRGDEEVVSQFAEIIPILAVTEGAAGARIYWNGDVRNFRPPKENEVDPVGAGDIFATSFFIRFHQTRDAWEAARFATLTASNSVTRITLNGVPTPLEVSTFMTQIVEQKNP